MIQFVLKRILVFSFLFCLAPAYASLCLSVYDSNDSHTIKNLKGYLIDNLGSQLVQSVTNKSKIYIFQGDGHESLIEMQKMGFQDLQRLKKSQGFHQIYSATKDNESIFVINRVNGQDRLAHIRSFFDLLHVSPKIEVVGKQRFWSEEYARALDSMGPPADLAVIGFSNSISQSLMPVKSYLFNPKMAWARLSSLIQKKKRVGVSDISTLPIQKITLRNGKTIVFFQNVYGDLILDVAQAIKQTGIKSVLYVGTAGSLNEQLPVGRVLQPREHLDGTVLKNLDWLERLDGVDVVGRHKHVQTPNVETMLWLSQQIGEKVDLIEVEIGHLLKFYEADRDSRLSVVTVISDSLVGPHHQDLTEWSKQDLFRLLPEFKRLISLKLGVESKDLVTSQFQVVNP